MGDAPRWFQLYWVSDRDVVASLVHRAEAASYAAVVVTLDTLVLGWRPRDLRNAYLPFREGEGIAQFTSDPVFRSRLAVAPEEDPLVAAGTMLAMYPNLPLRWDDLAWLRELTSLPLLVKGVLTAEDARRALDAGVDGIVVSNHGGRQVDEAIVVDEPGPGEVAVRIEASGVCHTDLHVVEENGWGHRLPVLLGHEGAGTVEQVGADVTGLAVGDRVVIGWKTSCGRCEYCARGEPRRCKRPPAAGPRLHRRDGSVLSPVLRTGTYATRTVVP